MIGDEQLTEWIPGVVDHIFQWFGDLSWPKLIFFTAAILVGIYLWRRRN